MHPAGGGREGLRIFIGDWSIIFVPLTGFARPNALDQARIPSAQFKEHCARIGVFLTDDPNGHAFYDFIIFADGSWFAWGYGWPKQQADIESTDFEALAGELLYSFVRDIFLTWNPAPRQRSPLRWTPSSAPICSACRARIVRACDDASRAGRRRSERRGHTPAFFCGPSMDRSGWIRGLNRTRIPKDPGLIHISRRQNATLKFRSGPENLRFRSPRRPVRA